MTESTITDHSERGTDRAMVQGSKYQVFAGSGELRVWNGTEVATALQFLALNKIRFYKLTAENDDGIPVGGRNAVLRGRGASSGPATIGMRRHASRQ